jgi:hypothetical protein
LSCLLSCRLFAAATIIGDVLENLPVDQRATISQQLQRLDLSSLKAGLRDLKAGRPTNLPTEMIFGTLMVGASLIVGKEFVEADKAEQSHFDLFVFEVFWGARWLGITLQLGLHVSQD